MARSIRSNNVRILWYYALFGFLWILITDWFLASLNLAPHLYSLWQTYKGWFFVATNALFLYLLLSYASRRDQLAQTALQTAEATYRLIFESNPLPMWIYDLETLAFLAVNDAAVDQYGYTREEFLKMTIRDIRPPEDVAQLNEEIRNTMRPFNHAGEWRHRRRDGGVFPVEIISHQLVYQGRSARLVVAYDLSERKAAAEALAASEERYRTLFENSHLVKFLIDPVDGAIVDANQSAADYYGWSIEELRRMNIRAINTAAPAKIQADMQSVRHGARRSFVFQHRLASGDIRDVEVFSGSISVGGRALLYSVIHDITERKQLEAALLNSEARFRRLAENAQDLIYRYDFLPTPHFSYVSPIVEKMTGYTAAEHYADPDLGMKLIHPDDQPRLHALRTGEMQSDDLINLRWQRKDGQILWVEQRNVPIYNDAGDLVAIESIARDITAHRQATEQLRLQSAALEAAANGIVLANTDGVIEWVNPAFSRLTGYTLEEVVGATLRDLVHSGTHSQSFYKTLWDTILAGHVWRGELVNRRKDGSLYSEEQTITPILNESGQITHFVGIKQDISERKKAEAERETLLAQLQAQAEQLAQIMRSVPEGILLLDGDGRILQANPMALKQVAAFGQTQGDRLTHLGHQALTSLLTSPLAGGLYHEIQVGGHVYEVLSRPVESGPIPVGWVLTIRDATQERAQEAQLRRQERLAVVGQLAAGIAHDFNNTLSVIVMYAGIMTKASHLSERDRDRLATIYQQALHASQMIGQILDFSRSSMMEDQALDLLPLLKEQIKLLQRTLPESIEIHLKAVPAEYITRVDPTRLAQVVMNLAVNARDAMPNGGVLSFALAKVEFATDKETPLAGMPAGTWIQITVSDTGVGMNAEVRDHLFEPFFTTKAPGQGTGLGLAQVYGIVQQHNGHIAVASQEGTGATFSIYLPALNPNPEETADPALDTMKLGRGERILLVEDDPTLREAMIELLTLWNYNVEEAANGEEALIRLSQADAPIALIISDAVMPRMGGVALFHSLLQRKLAVPLILLTGYPLQDELETLKAAGLYAWLPKPVNAQHLAETISTVLRDPHPVVPLKGTS